MNLIEYPKWFKTMLCSNFSKYMRQEMPETKFRFVDIKEVLTRPAYLQFRTLISRKDSSSKKMTLMWNLLQCKTLANTVPQSFIKDAYNKHSKQMTLKPEEITEDLRKEISNFVLPYVRNVRKLYKNRTRLPTNHATYSKKRSEGGLMEDLKSHLSHNTFLREYKCERFDPVVIHLSGKPGVGKSHSIEEICKRIGAEFGYNTRDFRTFSYYRSAATKHWDGYQNQLITIIDDIGFETPTRDSIQDSLNELLQLCSDCDYVLPMASLSDKGKKFTSKFLILTSNLLENHTYGEAFACKDALFRRISPTYKMLKTKNGQLRIYKEVYQWSQGEENTSNYKLEANTEGIWCQEGLCGFNHIIQQAIQTYLKRNSKFDNRMIVQEIEAEDETGPGYALRWDKPQLKVNQVMTHAIAEPLKVRMITKPQSISYALKPLQLAMHEALKKHSCFEPCWNPKYNLDQCGSPEKGKVFLSGDYTAATDELNFNVSQIVIELLAEEFKDDEFLSELIRWEGGSHLVSYPNWTNIDSVIQTNGQLMGSLLSFPILTILNAFTMCKATNSSLDNVTALFHGDDIAAQCTEEEILKWKECARSIGLQLSQGKNYISSNFVSIDSQLFVRKNNPVTCKPEMVKQITGKFRLVKRDDDNITTCSDAIRNGFTKEQIRKYNSPLLQKTIRSLDVSYEQGGLGLVTDSNRPFTTMDRAIYYVERRNKSTVQTLGVETFSVLKETAAFLKLPKANMHSVKETALSDNQLLKKVNRTIRRSAKYPEFNEYLKNLDMLRPLSTCQKVIVRCVNYSNEELQSFQDNMVKNFSKPKSSFNDHVNNQRKSRNSVRKMTMSPLSLGSNTYRAGTKFITPKNYASNEL